MKEEEWSCPPWDGYQYFAGDLLNGSQRHGQKLEPCLGEKFFEWNTISTRSIFELKNVPSITDAVCAIHFRGTDFHQWNINAVLGYEYYYNSIQKVKNSVDSFALFTDDLSLDSFKRVKYYLLSEDIDFSEGTRSLQIPSHWAGSNYIDDFSFMSECDYIISSPSTFCISAGFIGRKKKIIHSKEWAEDRVNNGDGFWADLLEGGNEDYSVWSLV